MKPTATDLETLFEKIKVKKGTAQLWRDILFLTLLFFGICVGFLAFGCLQYAVCYAKDNDITLKQCFRIGGTRNKF